MLNLIMFDTFSVSHSLVWSVSGLVLIKFLFTFDQRLAFFKIGSGSNFRPQYKLLSLKISIDI